MPNNIIKLTVFIQPNSKKTEIIDYKPEENILRLRVKAPALEGKANKELIDFLSHTLKIKKTDINIKLGEKSKKKLLEISGLDNIKF